MKKGFAGALVIALLPCLVSAETLPSDGFCERIDKLSSGLAIRTSVEWKDGKATVNHYSREISGEVVGMRSFDGGFRFSVQYMDEWGLQEIAVFQREYGGKTSASLGWVGYEELENGERVVKTAQGFGPATCIINRGL